jgi:D-glycero-alpha-D-manno-heptose-7-phosphate kinase
MKITSVAPCRISLFGGGSDVAPYSKKYGGEILNLAITLRHSCELIPRFDDWIIIEAMGETRIHKLGNLPVRGIDSKYDLIYETIESYSLLSGFHLVDSFNGIQGAGLGSSASACVSMVGAFNKWLNIKQYKLDIAKKAQQLELSLGWISGYQDQIASVYGGVNIFKGKGFPTYVKTIRFIPEFWEDSFVLIFTGRTRHSNEIQKKLVKGMNSKVKIEALDEMKKLVAKGFTLLKNGSVKELGHLLDESWELKKMSNPESTNSRINEIYGLALESGAYGGKVLGAGGDGHILFVCEQEDRRKLIRSLEDYGVKQIDFGIDWQGLEVIQQ